MSSPKFLTGLAAAILVAAVTVTPARADTFVVGDTGTLGFYTLTNTGITAGVSSLQLDLTLNQQSLQGLKTSGGAFAVETPVNFGIQILLSATPDSPGSFFYNVATDPLTLTKMIYSDTTDGNPIATVAYQLQTGQAGEADGDPQSLAFYGTNTGGGPWLASIGGTTYDFSSMLGGVTSIVLTTQDNTTMQHIMTTAGASVTGAASFSQTAVIPEPSSLAIVGVSLAGLLAYRRRFGKRAPTA